RLGGRSAVATLTGKPLLSPRRPSLGGLVLRGVAITLGGLLVLLLGLPLLSLVLRIPPADLLDRLSDPLILQALRLSLVTSLAATLVVAALGLPVAYLLATAEFRGKRVLEAFIDLPMVLPPTVAGVALLVAFGRAGLAGKALGVLGITLPFTTLGVVVAQAFVAAPFFVGAARAGFAEVDRKYLDAAATLRAAPGYAFMRVLVPLAAPSLLAGAAMSWARALGEFGATITFAGNMPGVTQTMPLAVYLALQSDLDAAVALSVLLLLVSLAVLLSIRLTPSRLAALAARARRAPR
ncbi:MAG TPA: ABC transporter permease, partial [Planctomycetota bacterium]|nr:ABC transporter permease [Planctomycetota bacterium]